MLKRGGEGRWRGEGARANTACSSKRGVMPLTPTHAETEADGDGDGGRLLVLLLMVAAGHRDWGQGRGCDPGGVLVTVAAANADDVLELLLLLITVVGADAGEVAATDHHYTDASVTCLLSTQLLVSSDLSPWSDIVTLVLSINA